MICGQCDGEGYIDDPDTGRPLGHACYHCGTTGHIDSETHRLDQIESVAITIARVDVEAIRRQWDASEDGEDWAFYAAEHMMSPGELFAAKVYERAADVETELASRPTHEIDLLIAWNGDSHDL